TRPLIKRAKARLLMATWLFVIGERNSGVARHRVVSSFLFFCFPSLLSGDEMAISIFFWWLYSINGVSLGGSCRRRKTASPLTVALVDQGKRRRKTVTVGESKGKDEWFDQEARSRLNLSISQTKPP
ncbi:hypothetical protein HID58_065210, partial [Brassica napus]